MLEGLPNACPGWSLTHITSEEFSTCPHRSPFWSSHRVLRCCLHEAWSGRSVLDEAAQTALTYVGLSYPCDTTVCVAMHRLALLGVLGLISFVNAASIQAPGLYQSPEAAQRAQEVKDVMISAYGDYRTYAFGYDQLLPLSKAGTNPRNGWGATIIDALDTLYIMGITDWFEEGVEFASKIDFSESQTPDAVNIFETIIRYVAGLLSAYELSGAKYPVLVSQAKVLADKLSYAWSAGLGNVPYTTVNFTTNQPIIATVGLAGAGSLILEFAKLTEYTGNSTYLTLAEKDEYALINQPYVFPGLAPQGYDPSVDQSVGDYITWGSGTDSFLEYLVKYSYMTGNADPMYIQAWSAAVDSGIRYLGQQSTVGDWTYLSDYSASEGGYFYQFSHLACFVGGNWLLGGRLLNNATIVDYALKLVDSCANSYSSEATGIGPEVFQYVPVSNTSAANYPPPGNLTTFYDLHGLWNTAADYVQRPEVAESIFYAWRVTGDTKYQDYAYEIFKAVTTYCKAPPSGTSYTVLDDVNVVPPTQEDDNETFFYAELLKYLYLTFSDPSLISLDEYVFNTEAHPYTLQSSIYNYNHPTSPLPTSSQPLAAVGMNEGTWPAPSGNPMLLPEPLRKDVFGL